MPNTMAVVISLFSHSITVDHTAIVLENDNIVHINHVEIVQLSNSMMLYSFYLLSVSALTFGHRSHANFLSTSCVI